MDVWDTFPQVSRRRDHNHPSFSSTLLDAIYRSIDDPNNDESLSTMRKKTHVNQLHKSDVDSARLQYRRKSTADSNSSSASSGGFSSSDSESFYNPKPIRTSLSEKMNHQYSVSSQKQSKREGGFVRTKSRALKIYSDLKKVKQPISPGGRLASFLNSLFTAGNAKKTKTEQQTAPSSSCSSASSFSRSCLSKAPSSGGKTSKRSVTFYPPVSVIVDEDCKPCGQKRLHEKQSDKEVEFRILEENRRVVEAAKELLKSYHKKKLQYDNGDHDHNKGVEDDEEDDDAASYASSDLFELDNLSAIGIERYREELPVYETTHLDTNRAIASAFFV